MSEWFLQLPVAIQAAIIGASASILAGSLKGIITKLWSSYRESKKTTEDVFRRYAEPLGSAATSLYWRLKEILSEDGRASFLVVKGARTSFEEYKLLSTYYRLMAVLGWIRAIRRELSYLRIQGGRRSVAIEKAIDSFQAALADGQHVENQLLDGLLALWKLPPPQDSKLSGKLAAELASNLKRFLHENQKRSASELEDDKKLKLCEEISGHICKNVHAAKISTEVLAETKAQAARLFDIREVWIYRDWQAAIGDMVIHEITSGSRRFEVCGYGEFESMHIAPNDLQKRWLTRIASLFEELDVHRTDNLDARPATLKNVFRGTAELITTLYDSHKKYRVVGENTVENARHMLDMLE